MLEFYIDLWEGDDEAPDLDSESGAVATVAMGEPVWALVTMAGCIAAMRQFHRGLGDYPMTVIAVRDGEIDRAHREVVERPENLWPAVRRTVIAWYPAELDRVQEYLRKSGLLRHVGE